METKGLPACLLAVRINSTVAKSPDIETTVRALRLRRKFEAGLVRNDESVRGMLRKVQALVTWGEPETATIAALLSKTEGIRGSRVNTDFAKAYFKESSISDLAASLVSGRIGLSDLERTGVQTLFRLHPPRAGFKRSTRRIFGDGGELGYRGSEINNLLRRMV